VLSGHYDHWKVLAEVEVEEDCDYVDFTGLDINRDWEYYLDAVIKNPSSSKCDYFSFVEEDYTITNYYCQYLHCSGDVIGGARASIPLVLVLEAGERALINVRVTKDPDGYYRYISSVNRQTGSAQKYLAYAGSKTAPVSNITSLRVSADISGAIGAGSRFILARPRG